MNRMKIVCWVGESPNHKALVTKISKEFKVEGIVIDRTMRSFARPLPGFLKKMINKMRFNKADRAWQVLQSYYASNYMLPREIESFFTDSINTLEVLNFTKKFLPDIILVSGTSLIKDPLLSMQLPVGIINLHTGLSPYVKGGPNCTNWCIANNEWSLIGNTVLWLSAGIDSGHIITSEKTDITEAESLYDIHYRVMEHAHDLYLRAIRYMMESDPPYQSISQKNIGKGTLYLNKMWTSKQKKKLSRNLKTVRNFDPPFDIKTIQIPV